MFNNEQRDYMRYLATVPAEQKCYCGWYRVNECPNCKDGASLADRLKVQCPGCHNYPYRSGKPTVTHRIGCTSHDWQPAQGDGESK